MNEIPAPLIVHVTRALTRDELFDLSRRATLTLWEAEALETFDREATIDSWLRRPYVAVVIIDRELSGFPLAAALRSDWLAMTSQSTLVVKGGRAPRPPVILSEGGGAVGERRISARQNEQSGDAAADILAALAARSSKRLLPMLLRRDAQRASGIPLQEARPDQRVPDAHCASLRSGAAISITAEEAFGAGIADSLVASGEDSLKWLRSWLGARSLRALDSAATLLRTNRSEAGERIEFARLFSTGEPQRGLSHFLEKTPAPFASEITVETI